MAATQPDVQQIFLSLSVEQNSVVPATAASKAHQKKDVEVIREHTLAQFGSAPAFNLHERIAPFSICLTQDFAARVRDIHVLLDRALVDILERWFSDEEANFPARMPLERHEEDLLQWIYGPGSALVPPFRQRYGMWRTDYLLEGDVHGKQSIKICEINARIPFNGIWISGSQYTAYEKLICKAGMGGFEFPDDFEKTKQVINSNFDISKPIFHIHDKWPGVDSLGFVKNYTLSTGQQVKHARPSELRLEPDSHAPGGYRLLYCPNDGSPAEEIEQCTLELFQEELINMDPILLRKISTCCFNDFRNILFIHDKRILGIVLDELDNLVAKNVLTKAEAARLRGGVSETLLPGSEALKTLLEQSKSDPDQKNEWIVKPVRDASCTGITLGKDMTQDEWLTLLEEQAERRLRPTEGAFVIQRLTKHIWFDIMNHIVDSMEPEKFHLIGAHHFVNSRYNMFGPFRLGTKVHVGFSGDNKGIVMGAVLRPDSFNEEDKKAL